MLSFIESTYLAKSGIKSSFEQKNNFAFSFMFKYCFINLKTSVWVIWLFFKFINSILNWSCWSSIKESKQSFKYKLDKSMKFKELQ